MSVPDTAQASSEGTPLHGVLRAVQSLPCFSRAPLGKRTYTDPGQRPSAGTLISERENARLVTICLS